METEPEPEPEPVSASVSASRMAALRAALGKKGSFVRATGELRQLVCEAYQGCGKAEREGLFALVSRCKTLLSSRYTSPPYWRAGCALFLSCVSFMDEQDRQASLQEWVLLAEDQLQAGEMKELRREAEERRARATRGATAEAAPVSGVLDPAAALTPEAVAQQLARFMSEAGLGLGAAMAEEMGGLEGLAEQEEGAPPASRDARDALRLVTVPASGQSCAICLEDFGPKAKAKQLPCEHLFHESCVIEWLERHNSCPVCRFALASEKRTFDVEAAEIRGREATSSGLYS